MDAFYQSMLTQLIWSLTHRDSETEKFIFQILLD